MTFVLFLRKFWPVFVIVALAFVVLFQRNTITARTADRDAALVRVSDVTDANKSLAGALANVKQAQVDNDAIAAAVAKALEGNKTRVIEYRTTIEKVKANDPAVRDWSSVPVPDSVRAALRTHSDGAPRP